MQPSRKRPASSPRSILAAALTSAIESGDVHAMRVAHEALGRLLDGDRDGDVVDLASERVRRHRR
jgi:hypothetical protein